MIFIAKQGYPCRRRGTIELASHGPERFLRVDNIPCIKIVYKIFGVTVRVKVNEYPECHPQYWSYMVGFRSGWYTGEMRDLMIKHCGKNYSFVGYLGSWSVV